jgi:glutathione S-transferase
MPQTPPQKLTLYTSKISIFGQRVSIVLHHLKVPFTEVLIPLDRPREPWYLAINPRGMVPALEIEELATGTKEVAVESALICHFLLDLARGWDGEFAARAEEIFPQGHDLATVAKRYRQRYYIDVCYEKMRLAGRPLVHNPTEEAYEAFLAAVKEIEPFCPQPGHFFDGSKTITLVEVIIGPYMMRLDAGMRWGNFPEHLSDKLQVVAPNFYAWMKTMASSDEIKASTWDEEAQKKYTNERRAKLAAQAQK